MSLTSGVEVPNGLPVVLVSAAGHCQRDSLLCNSRYWGVQHTDTTKECPQMTPGPHRLLNESTPPSPQTRGELHSVPATDERGRSRERGSSPPTRTRVLTPQFASEQLSSPPQLPAARQLSTLAITTHWHRSLPDLPKSTSSTTTTSQSPCTSTPRSSTLQWPSLLPLFSTHLWFRAKR